MKCDVIESNREVIGEQLLAVLNDRAKVACIFDADDLDTVIAALTHSLVPGSVSLLQDLRQLRAAAFPYHRNACCGICHGPLEGTRDAVCETCAPEPKP